MATLPSLPTNNNSSPTKVNLPPAKNSAVQVASAKSYPSVMTDAQMTQLVNQGVAKVPQAPVQAQGLTDEELNALEATSKQNAQPQQPQPIKLETNITGDYAKNLGDTYKSAVTSPETAGTLGDLGSILNEGQRQDKSTSQNPIIRTGENALAMTAQTLNTIFAPFGAAAKSLTDKISQQIENTVNVNDKNNWVNNPIVQKITNFVQGSSNEISQLAQDHPEAARNLSNSLGVIITALSGKAGGEEGLGLFPKQGLDTPIGTLQGVQDAIVNKTANLPETIQNMKENVGNAINNTKNIPEQSAIDNWAKPTTKPIAGFKTATTIYNNAKNAGNDIGETLVKNGVKLSENIEDGKYATSETAKEIRTDAGKMSNEMLRPALEKADTSGVAKTPVSEVLNKTISDIKNSKGITAGDMENQIRNAKTQAAALSRKYPEGMSLSNMHDEKINYAMNGGYKPLGTVLDNNLASTNRSFGRVLANEVETKAPSDIPVKEFNAELQKQYQAADYLDAINTKKVPIGIGTKLIRAGAKAVGATVGSNLGIGGAFGGYSLGGTLENMVENMPTNIRDGFLNNLKTTNPEAFTQISNYLKTSK